jgi:hypothetical protein
MQSSDCAVLHDPQSVTIQIAFLIMIKSSRKLQQHYMEDTKFLAFFELVCAFVLATSYSLRTGSQRDWLLLLLCLIEHHDLGQGGSPTV